MPKQTLFALSIPYFNLQADIGIRMRFGWLFRKAIENAPSPHPPSLPIWHILMRVKRWPRWQNLLTAYGFATAADLISMQALRRERLSGWSLPPSRKAETLGGNRPPRVSRMSHFTLVKWDIRLNEKSCKHDFSFAKVVTLYTDTTFG